jgi:hypothetical protein
VTYYPNPHPWWRDGLIWSVIGCVALGILVGFALGTIVAL